MNKVFAILYIVLCFSVGLVFADEIALNSYPPYINNTEEVEQPKTAIDQQIKQQIKQQKERIETVNNNVVSLQTKIKVNYEGITNKLEEVSSTVSSLNEYVSKKRNGATPETIVFIDSVFVLIIALISVAVGVWLKSRLNKSFEEIKFHQEKFNGEINKIQESLVSQLNQIFERVNIIPSDKDIGREVESRWGEKFNYIADLVSNNTKKGGSNENTSSVNQILSQIYNDTRKLQEEFNRFKTSFESNVAEVNRKYTELNVQYTNLKLRENKISDQEKNIANQINNAKLEQRTHDEERINQLSREKESLQKDKNLLQGEINNLKDEKAKLESSISEKCQEEHKKAVESQKEFISDLSKKIGALETNLKNEQNQVKEKIEATKLQTASEYSEKINNLTASVTEKDKIIAEKVNSVNKALQDKVNAEKISEQQRKEIDQLNVIINNKDQLISQAKQEIDNIKNQAQQDINNIKRNVAELEQTNSSLKKANEDLQLNCSNQKNEINQLKIAKEDADKIIDLLQKSNYPNEFINDEDFVEPKKHLDQWINNQIAGANLVMASLNVVANKSTLLDSSDFYSALHNISLGISTALYEQGQSVSNVIEEFKLWNKFISKYSDDTCDFQLQIPQSGAIFDNDWMCSTKKIARVTKVKSWACFSNKWGIQKSAGVE